MIYRLRNNKNAGLKGSRVPYRPYVPIPFPEDFSLSTSIRETTLIDAPARSPKQGIEREDSLQKPTLRKHRQASMTNMIPLYLSGDIFQGSPYRLPGKNGFIWTDLSFLFHRIHQSFDPSSPTVRGSRDRGNGHDRLGRSSRLQEEPGHIWHTP